MQARAAATPLIEVIPASPGDRGAALGFALGWIAGHNAGLMVWAAADLCLGENGAPHARGLAQFGLDPDRLVLAQTKTASEALWAAEQALSTPCATVLCVTPPGSKPPSLTATRRLLLLAEKNDARCVMLRFDVLAPSAAWSRWRVTAAPSVGAARELGPPRFAVDLERTRAGGAGQSWLLEWNVHDHAFTDAGRVSRKRDRPLDGDLAAKAVDRSAATQWRRAS